jgi:hypothetical protein
MATVRGIKEKVHLPIYDSIQVEPEKQLREIESSSTLKFFVNVQGKTKLETNLQAASLLPHYNTFEARAMRVVISDLPPQFPDDDKAPTITDEDLPVTGTDTNDNEVPLVLDGNSPTGASNVALGGPGGTAGTPITADFEITLGRAMDLLREARESDDQTAELSLDDDDVTLHADGFELTPTQVDQAAGIGDPLSFTVIELEDSILDTDNIPDRQQPPLEQIRPNNGAGNLISKLIFNTVTTLYVGEKIMIEMPTWFFPGGAGAYSEGGRVITHGEPSPAATFRFAEAIFFGPQQNFRVELEIPDRDVLTEIQKIYGPLFIWVVLDGYMTRDVQ